MSAFINVFFFFLFGLVLLISLAWLLFSLFVTMLWLNVSRELSTMKLLATLLGEYIYS
jgi:hypothetical protein